MSKWIKCSDRMPEDETDVLVAVYGTDMLTVEDDSFEGLQKAIEDSRKSVRYTTMACYISGDGWYSEGYPMIMHLHIGCCCLNRRRRKIKWTKNYVM